MRSQNAPGVSGVSIQTVGLKRLWSQQHFQCKAILQHFFIFPFVLFGHLHVLVAVFCEGTCYKLVLS